MKVPAIRTPEGPRPRDAERHRLTGLAVLVVIVVLALGGRLGANNAGPQEETRELRAAIATMTTVVDDLPEEVQAQIEPEVRVLAHALHRVLARIENQPAPIVDGELVGHLTYLADVVGALDDELLAARGAGPGVAASELAQKVRQLAAAAEARLDEVDAAIDRWSEVGADAIVEVDAGPDAVIVRSTDRMLHDLVRYSATALFFVALLALGLRFLALSETGTGIGELFRQMPLLATAGAAAIAVFLLGSLILAINPGAIAGPTRIVVQPQAHPCGTLAAQRRNLWDAQRVGNERLLEAIEARIRPAGQACLQLDSEFAAIEAVERFIAAPPPAVAMPDDPRPRVAAEAPAEPGARELERLISALEALVPATPPVDDGRTEVAAAADARAVTADETAAPPEAAEVAAPEPPASEPTTEVAATETASTERTVPVPPEPAPRDLVTTTAVNYRTGPSLDAERLGTLPAGTPVVFLSEESGWSAVQLEDGRAVYVSSDFLQAAQ